MTTPENPERLWAARYRDDDGFEYVAVFERPEHAEESHRHGADAEVQAYVREDVAAVEAVEGRYAVLVQYDDREPTTFMDLDMSVPDARHRDVGTHAEVLAAVENETPAFRRMAVRILPDGAHEAALAAARREERERVLLELRGTLVRCCVDFAEDAAHAGGLAHAVRCIEDMIQATKGQAK